MTVRQDIRDRVILELNAAPPSGVPQATRRRYVPGTRLTEPRIAVFFIEEPTSRQGGRAGALAQRRLTIAVQAVLPVENPEGSDEAMEPLLAHIVATLGATTLD